MVAQDTPATAKDAGGSRWDALLEAIVGLAGGEAGLLLVREGEAWRKMMVYPPEDDVFRGAALDGAIMKVLRDDASGEDSRAEGGLWFQCFPGFPEVAMVVRGSGTWKGPADAARRALGLLSQVPGLQREADPTRRMGGRIENMALVLDLVVLVNSVEKFEEAVLKVVNEVAARCGCQRVSLGWSSAGFCKVRAVSHADRVDRKAVVVGLLEAAMDECFEQDAEIVLPAVEGETAAMRDHQILHKESGGHGLASLPLRSQGTPAGVLTLERERPWRPEEIAALRLTSDLLGPVLAAMERRSRWIGARCWHTAREKAGELLGPHHTGWKLAGLAALVALAVLFLGGMNYRVEAPFLVESDSVALVTAPFDGFLDRVGIRVGDDVPAGGMLFSLDTRELSLEEARHSAEWRRHSASALKAEGEENRPELRIARAAADQSKAELDLVQYRLKQAEVKAPFDGVVIEGDLREKLGAPVRQGDVMVKLVRLDELYLEILIDERDIDDVKPGAEGEIAFTADPARTFAFRIERVEPATQTRDEGNVFAARAVPLQGVEDWWRPGMAGVAKINAGRRSFWWILTHRTTDFLRMKLWWW